MEPLNILFAGESWIKHTIHMKGFDQFHSTEYEEGATTFLNNLAAEGHTVNYIRGHEISSRFPKTAQEIDEFDVVVISDIGSNSFQLPDETFLRSQASPNRLSVVADYVGRGGGLVMIGGYLSFTGIDAKARFGMTPLANVLPVTMLPYDDRIEIPEGCKVEVCAPDHPVLGETPSDWPLLLGFNRVIAKDSADVVAHSGDDPILVTGGFGAGRAVAFTSDLAPHWAPPEFVEWSGYPVLWTSILSWASGRS
ncbi:Putative glutamine amidotransferase domain-containing protein [Williamsia muralis]|uniref:glutamine amidotransferase n=1 Tax=Williamsia marianensis TaxID=85044 RepID=UPI0039E9C254